MRCVCNIIIHMLLMCDHCMIYRMGSIILLDESKVCEVNSTCIAAAYILSELIITSGGENIAPVPIEDRIKKEVPFFSNVMVVGDHRNYLTCLVTLKVCHSILSS